MATTSLNPGEHWEAFIRNEVASGRYGSASEVIRDALYQMADRNNRLVPHFALFFSLRALQTRPGKVQRAGNSSLYCHVPREGIDKFVRKLQASREVYHHLLGTIDTPAKFDAERMELARHVWRIMKDTDSRECRNCHAALSMDYDKQEPRSAERHEQAEEEDLTCIDCHKGIVHSLPAEYDPKQDIPGESIYYDEANTSLKSYPDLPL